jgi:hypothetical protein
VIAELSPSAWRFLASWVWFCDTPEEKGLKLATHSCRIDAFADLDAITSKRKATPLFRLGRHMQP